MPDMLNDDVDVCIDCYMDHHEGRVMKDTSVTWTDNTNSETGEGITDFSGSACGACGTTLAGNRFRMATWELPKWPDGKNAVLSIFREGFDKGDALASTVGMEFAICDALTTLDASDNIPDRMEFRQAMGGPDDEDYNYQAIMALMVDGEYVYAALTRDEVVKHLTTALLVLDRFDSVLRANGWDL